MEVQKGQTLAIMEDPRFIQLQQDYLVTEGKVFEDGMLIMGSPAKAVRPLSEADITRMQMGTALYVSKSAQYRTDMVRIDAPKE